MTFILQSQVTFEKNPNKWSYFSKLFFSYQLLDTWAWVYGFPEAHHPSPSTTTSAAALPVKLYNIIERIRNWKSSALLRLFDDALCKSNTLIQSGQQALPHTQVGFEGLEGRPYLDIAHSNLRRAEEHDAMSDLHRIIEQLHLISFTIGALSPVRLALYPFSLLTLC